MNKSVKLRQCQQQEKTEGAKITAEREHIHSSSDSPVLSDLGSNTYITIQFNLVESKFPSHYGIILLPRYFQCPSPPPESSPLEHMPYEPPQRHFDLSSSSLCDFPISILIHSLCLLGGTSSAGLFSKKFTGLSPTLKVSTGMTGQSSGLGT